MSSFNARLPRRDLKLLEYIQVDLVQRNLMCRMQVGLGHTILTHFPVLECLKASSSS